MKVTITVEVEKSEGVYYGIDIHDEDNGLAGHSVEVDNRVYEITKVIAVEPEKEVKSA